MAAPPPERSVQACVVLHHPDPELLRQQFEATRPQVEAVIYYDNGNGKEALASLGLLSQPGVHCLGDGSNRGLATAINEALALVRTSDAAFALLLDQDSLPAPDMVDRLRAAHTRAAAGGSRVAAVGPSIFDALSGKLERFGHAVSFARRRIPRPGERRDVPFDAHYLITSGTLLHLPALADVGLLEDSLFIDSVDFEWSFRARAMGYRLLGTYDTSLRHRRGERLHRPLPGVRIRLHPAQRLYYIYRNHVRLCFRGYMPLVWKLRGLRRLLNKAVLFALFVPRRAAHLRAMAQGVRDGLRLGLADRGRQARSPPRG